MKPSTNFNSSLVLKLKKNQLPETIYSIHYPEEKGKYPIIDVPANGKPNWSNGAFTLCFVYSKYHGNFILRGYRGEVMDFLKENFTHYFCYISMWHRGKSRGHWKFWKDKIVDIYEPNPRSKYMRSYKYQVVKHNRSNGNNFKQLKKFEFKRMPHKWIPEFDKL